MEEGSGFKGWRRQIEKRVCRRYHETKKKSPINLVRVCDSPTEYLILHFLLFYVPKPFLRHIISRIFSRPFVRSLARMQTIFCTSPHGYVSLNRFDNRITVYPRSVIIIWIPSPQLTRELHFDPSWFQRRANWLFFSFKRIFYKQYKLPRNYSAIYSFIRNAPCDIN